MTRPQAQELPDTGAGAAGAGAGAGGADGDCSPAPPLLPAPPSSFELGATGVAVTGETG
jgi:hypothetical protein